MKLLVLSDSHGHDEQLVSIIWEHPEADALIFLGDGERDFDTALFACRIGNDKIVCQVRGNCDLASREPDKIVRTFGGVSFLITHGHEQNAKLGVWGLIEEAKKQHCNAVLYGHTHRQSFLEREGITLINPGSAREGRYLIVEVSDGKVSVPEQ
ncbi:MAG: YfcE family phosphodiesterase [Parasporobacterium sp.]|nr:YfcE family phosphodiesterase [Parasporobacterium sp.]